jgi:hypothetical protein
VSKRHSNPARIHHKATDPDVWVSVPRAATLLDCNRNTVYNMIARGQLQADHIAGRLVVRKSSLVDIQKERATA